jgi:hypothetical protein
MGAAVVGDPVRLSENEARGPGSIGQWAKIRLRAETTLREFMPDAWTSRPPRPIVFFHVPKCGGTSIKKYMHACLGSKASGRSGKVSEVFNRPPPGDAHLRRARQARFIHARCSWSAVQRLDLPDDAFVFTFLRDPGSRLGSWHRYASSLPEESYTQNIAEIFRRSKGLTRLEMFTSADPEVRCMIDNYMVRQFAGRVLDYPVRDDEWPQLLETAKARLRRISFVGFHATYASDFMALADMLNLPRAISVPHENSSRVRLVERPAAAHAHLACDDEEAAATAPLIAWDQQLYAYAQTLRAPIAGGTL